MTEKQTRFYFKYFESKAIENQLMSEDAILELSEIMGTQDEAILEMGELLSQLIAGGEDSGSILSETN